MARTKLQLKPGQMIEGAGRTWTDWRGFVISEALPGPLQRIVDEVVPVLQKRGSFREEYAGSTFRESLGLAKPTNRYTLARAAE